MRNRLFRTVPHGSGIAFAAATVALMSFHGLPSGGSSVKPSRDRNVAAQPVSEASQVRSNVTKVDFNPAMFHNPYTR